MATVTSNFPVITGIISSHTVIHSIVVNENPWPPRVKPLTLSDFTPQPICTTTDRRPVIPTRKDRRRGLKYA